MRAGVECAALRANGLFDLRLEVNTGLVFVGSGNSYCKLDMILNVVIEAEMFIGLG